MILFLRKQIYRVLTGLLGTYAETGGIKQVQVRLFLR